MDIYKEKSSEKDASYLLSYLESALIPASKDFFLLLSENRLKLHHAYSFNAILAHAIDYIAFIAKKKSNISRAELIRTFDERYAVDGCKHINNKFTLLDAVNNSFKHVELDKNRYAHLTQLYGDLSFNCLKPEQGKVFFEMPLYKFDYSRVVLRPIAKIFDCALETTNDIDDFINGRIFGSTGYGTFSYDYEPYDAIDRMIDYCNSECMDCGESDQSCDCPSFIYGQSKGEFNPNYDHNFDFPDVMSDISGTREWKK